MTEQGVGTNRYAYANNDPVNKFDPEGNSWISNIIGIALSFIPGLQPAGAALIAAGLSAVETVAAGGDLGDALKSATITFATTLAMHNIQEGVFGRADIPDMNEPRLSTQGFDQFDDPFNGMLDRHTQPWGDGLGAGGGRSGSVAKLLWPLSCR